MAEKTSPFLEAKWGWPYGSNGWNSGADENWLKFSYMFDRNVDGIVSSLPPAVNGTAYFNTVDNRFYFVVDGAYYSSPCPKWFVFSLRSTGDLYKFDGSTTTLVPSNESLDARLDATELTLSRLQDTSNVTYGDALVAVLQPHQSSVGRTQHEKNTDVWNVMDFGAIGTPDLLSSIFPNLAAAQAQYPFVTSLSETVDSTAFKAAAFAAEIAGGARIYIPAKTFYAYEVPLISKVYWEGAGKEATVITQPNGFNKDIFVSKDFVTLSGVGPLRDAPKGFGITNLTVDGNYLADYRGASIGADTTINNSTGYGVKIAGSKYTIDIELVNCPQVGFYSEAVDYSGYGDEQSCTIRIDGRVFGKEGFVYRGPADCNIEHLILGSVGWLPTLAERRSTIVFSDLYPGEVVDVMVSDEEDIGLTGLTYNGHHEFGMIHLYGNLSGLAYRTRNTGRLKGNHMVCENCRGGAYFGSRVWGNISILECHNNQREPSDLATTLAPLPDIHNASLQGFTVNATVRHTTTQAATKLALKDVGRNSKIILNYFTAGGSFVPNAYVADIASLGSSFDITLQDTNQDAIVVSGLYNKLVVYANDVTTGAVVRRVAGPSSVNRSNDIEVHTRNNVLYAFSLDGLVTNERLAFFGELVEGGAIFNPANSQPDPLNRSVLLEVSGRVGTAQYSSHDIGRVDLDNTSLAEQTVTVSHNYFQTPLDAQVVTSLADPSPTYNGVFRTLPRFQSATSTQITFVYQLETLGTVGGVPRLCWQIN